MAYFLDDSSLAQVDPPVLHDLDHGLLILTKPKPRHTVAMTISERLAKLADGEDPKMIMRLKSGFAVMSDSQFLPGYCLLLAYPEVKSLNDLSADARIAFLHDMALLGDAVQRATECKRVNYGIYGNQDPFLHAHVVPRFEEEAPELATVPPLSYPIHIREADEHKYDPFKHTDIAEAIRLQLHLLLGLEHDV